MARPLKAHQTTIRFTDQQWEELERAAAALGVSVAQFVRDAARERLERHAELPARDLRRQRIKTGINHVEQQSLELGESTAALWEQGRLARERALAFRRQRPEGQDARDRRVERPSSTAALWEQGRLARERARLLREETRKSNERRAGWLPRVPGEPAPVEDAGRVVREPLD